MTEVSSFLAYLFMNKNEFIRVVCDRLKQDGKRKPISIPKQSFTISDDEGNTKVFYVKKRDKTAMYSIGDVEAILEACVESAKDLLAKGDSVTLHGFGTLELVKRAPHWGYLNGERIDIAEHYVPKFSAAKGLRMAAKLYDLSVEEAGEAEGGEQ